MSILQYMLPIKNLTSTLTSEISVYIYLLVYGENSHSMPGVTQILEGYWVKIVKLSFKM